MTIRVVASRPAIPGKITHFHQACQHFCAGETCLPESTRDVEPCRHCRTKAANERMQAEYLARQAQA